MDKKFNSRKYSGDFFVEGSTVDRVRIMIDMVGTGKKVLDVGCGDGFLAPLILKNENKYCGIDVSENAIKSAKAKGLDVYDCDLKSDWHGVLNEKFDIIIAGEVIEHIFDTDRFLKNIYSALKDEGKLILSTPNIASLGRRLFLLAGISPLIESTARKDDSGHIRYFTFATLRKLLQENGFKIISFRSDSVNFDNSGRFSSRILARFFTALGASLIVECAKSSPLNPS